MQGRKKACLATAIVFHRGLWWHLIQLHSNSTTDYLSPHCKTTGEMVVVIWVCPYRCLSCSFVHLRKFGVFLLSKDSSNILKPQRLAKKTPQPPNQPKLQPYTMLFQALSTCDSAISFRFQLSQKQGFRQCQSNKQNFRCWWAYRPFYSCGQRMDENKGI